MTPQIRLSSEKRLIGMRARMSLSDNKTFALWSTFMPRRKEIESVKSTDLISMEVYDTSTDFSNFNQHISFDKWAAVEVNDLNNIPAGMESFMLSEGLYAVFRHKGFAKTIDYIFGVWLPDSEYHLDTRPHFAVMGERYKNGDPESEEELWVPIKSKSNI